MDLQSGAIPLPEKRGIAQARADDPLVAAPDRIGVGAVDIGDGDKTGGQLTRGRVLHGKIFLVRLHTGNQRFLWQIQKFRVE